MKATLLSPLGTPSTPAVASAVGGGEARILRVLAETAASGPAPDLDAAQRLCREALDLANELAMRPLVAHCHLSLGKLFRRTGKREQAQEHLTTATTRYREMWMTYWLKQTEAELQGFA